MTKHVHMSPPRRESSAHAGAKLFRRVLALFVMGAAIVWAGGNGQGETPVAKFATKLSERWDRSVTRAPHVLTPLLRRAEIGARGTPALEDAGILGSQAAPSLAGRLRGTRKAP
jgi:hypothetical protein